MASLSLWLRDIPLTDQQRRRLLERRVANGRARGLANQERRLRREAEIRRAATEQVGRLSQRDLFVAGVIAYAAEGSKRKPWLTSCQVQFVNSDPGMIRLFLAWLDLVGVDRDAVKFRLAIHEDADAGRALNEWAHILAVSPQRFHRTTLKRGNPRTRRRNVGKDYRGCLVVHVRRSGDLNKRLEALFQSIVDRLGPCSYGRVRNEGHQADILGEPFRGSVTGQHVTL
jgi:hypothetical protein